MLKFKSAYLAPVIPLFLIATSLSANTLKLPLSGIEVDNVSGTLVHEEEIDVGGSSYLVMYFLDEKAQTVTNVYFNGQGERIDKIPEIPYKPERIDPSLLHAIDQGSEAGQKIDVSILLNIPQAKSSEDYSSAGYRNEKGETTYFVDGRISIHDDVIDLQEKYSELRLNARFKKSRIIEEVTNKLLDVNGLSESHLKSTRDATSYSLIDLTLTPSEIRRVISDVKHVKRIGLTPVGEDDIAGAMLETNIDPEALTRPNHTGDGIGIYQTENGCANAGEVPNYTRLAGPLTAHSRRVLGVMAQASPDSWKYCRGGRVLPTNADLDGTGGNPPIHIINRSNSFNSDRLYDDLAQTWDEFAYDNELAMVQTPGNTGLTTNFVRSPGVALNLITIGNYNDATGNIWATSPGLDPLSTLNNKPELVAPGTNIVVPNIGGTATGTSFAAPHVSAFIANLMENFAGYRFNPYLVKASLISGSRNDVGGNAEAVEEGGVDYLQHVNGDQVNYWRGNSGTFDWLDVFTDGVDDEWMTHQFWLSSSYTEATVSISWLLRGSYIADNLGSAQPMGANYDFMVLRPNGSYVGGGWSYHNPYDTLTFDPDASGFYKIKIRRTSNGDSSAKFHMGYAVNWQ